MQYGSISGVEQPVSRIFLGTATAPFNVGGDGTEMLETALALGINAIDTARVYGRAENSLGQWLQRPGNRERVVLLTKCGHPAPDGTRRVNGPEMKKDLAISLDALRTDHVEVLLLHRDDPEIPVGEIMETFQEMWEQGSIRAFGGSNWTRERIQEANDYAAAHGLRPMTASSPQFGLASQVVDPWGGNCVSISGPAAEADRAWYRENQLPMIAYSSLGHGMMSGRFRSDDPAGAESILDPFGKKGFLYPENLERLRRCEMLAAEKNVTVPQLALRWIFRQGLNAFAAVSCSRPERLPQNAEALEIALTAAEADWLDLRGEKPGK